MKKLDLTQCEKLNEMINILIEKEMNEEVAFF